MGGLSPERAEAVDAYLAAHPEGAGARLSQYAEQRQALRAAFAAQAGGPIPPRLRVAHLPREAVVAGASVARSNRRCAGPSRGGLDRRLGCPGHDDELRYYQPRQHPPLPPRAMIPADVIAAHRRTSRWRFSHPVEVGAGAEAHLVQWLSKRLGRPLVVPDPAAVGFRLMGGRLPPAEDGPAAQFHMRTARGGRVTLYLSRRRRRRNGVPLSRRDDGNRRILLVPTKALVM